MPLDALVMTGLVPDLALSLLDRLAGLFLALGQGPALEDLCARVRRRLVPGQRPQLDSLAARAEVLNLEGRFLVPQLPWVSDLADVLNLIAQASRPGGPLAPFRGNPQLVEPLRQLGGLLGLLSGEIPQPGSPGASALEQWGRGSTPAGPTPTPQSTTFEIGHNWEGGPILGGLQIQARAPEAEGEQVRFEVRFGGQWRGDLIIEAGAAGLVVSGWNAHGEDPAGRFVMTLPVEEP